MFSALLRDRLVQLLLAVIVLANLFPAEGAGLSVARTISSVGIFLLFLLNGIRLPRNEVIAGVRNWRLQGAIFLWIFVAMSLIGFALAHLFAPWLPEPLVLGIIFLGSLPTTVQSAAAYCSLAGGNVAATVVASAVNNLVGVLLTPLLFALLASTAGAQLSGDSVVRILTILLLPFLIGQAIQKWTFPLIAERKAIFSTLDKAVIVLAVYVALSGAVTSGTWHQLSGSALATMALAILMFLALGFGGAWIVASKSGFDWPDRKAMLFSGAQKSIAIGAPLAAILFDPKLAGFVLLPVILYHVLQLVLSAPLANRLVRHRASPA